MQFTSDDVGCYFDGAHGWHNHYRIVLLAITHGMSTDRDDRACLEYYETGGDDAETVETVTGQGGLVDQAVDYLQSLTADGLVWDLEADELVLTSEDQLEP